MAQNTETLLIITIDDYELDAVDQFTYLDSTMTDNLSLDTQIDQRIEKAATTLACLTTLMWINPLLTVETKVTQRLCHQHTVLRQRDMDYLCQTGEKTQNLPLRSIRRILGTSRKNRVRRRGPVSCWPSQYVHSAQAAQTALAGSCPLHE